MAVRGATRIVDFVVMDTGAAAVCVLEAQDGSFFMRTRSTGVRAVGGGQRGGVVAREDGAVAGGDGGGADYAGYSWHSSRGGRGKGGRSGADGSVVVEGDSRGGVLSLRDGNP